MSDLKSELLKFNANFFPANPDEILKTQGFLQVSGKVMMNKKMTDFYSEFGAIILGDAEIFGLKSVEFGHGSRRSLSELNDDFKGSTVLGSRTVFGRNGLFLFAVSIDGKYQMLEIFSAKTAKTYDDFESAVRDCLLVGAL